LAGGVAGFGAAALPAGGCGGGVGNWSSARWSIVAWALAGSGASAAVPAQPRARKRGKIRMVRINLPDRT